MEKYRIFAHKPARILEGQVPPDETSWEYPLEELTIYNTISGNLANVKAGMTVLVGSFPGNDDYGSTFVRHDYDGVSGTIQIARAPQGNRAGELNLRPDAYVTVLDDYRIWAKVPKFVLDGEDVTVYKHTDIEFGTNVTLPPPVANAGPPQMGRVDAVTGKLVARFPEELEAQGNQSWAVATGATLTDYEWELPAGVSLTSGFSLTDEVIEVEADPGFYWIHLTVTDSNGKSHTAHTFLIADDPDDSLTIEAVPVSRRLTRDGAELTIELLQDLDRNEYPDGMLVAMWVKYDDSTQAEPPNPYHRSHIRFWGWHAADPANLQTVGSGLGWRRGTQLECVGALGRLKELPGFAFSVGVDDETFEGWDYMPDANWLKLILYLLHWHTTALDLIEFLPRPALAAINFYARTCAATNMYEQVQGQCAAVVPKMVMTSSYLNFIKVDYDPLEQHPDDRTTHEQGGVWEGDIFGMSYVHRHWPRYHWLRTAAVEARNDTLPGFFFSIAPNEAPGMGTNKMERREAIVANQEILNKATGVLYSRINAPVETFSIDLGLNDHHYDPGYLTWVTVQLPKQYASRRGLRFVTSDEIDKRRGMPLEIVNRYEAREEGVIVRSSMVWEAEPLYYVDGVTDTSRGYD